MDLIAQADSAAVRAEEEEQARIHAGYPLGALAEERQAVAALREALTSAVASVLEICQKKAGPGRAGVGSGSQIEGGFPGMGGPEEGGTRRGPQRTGVTRGPPSALVKVLCSGEDADVRCSGASEYKLSKGVAGRCSSASAGSRTENQRNQNNLRQGQPTAAFSPPPPLRPSAAVAGPETLPGSHPLRLRDAAVAVAESGTMARTILQGLLDSDAAGASGGQKTAQPCKQRSSSPSPAPGPTLAPPALAPRNPQEALSAARAAATDTIAFLNETKISVEQQKSYGDTEARTAGGHTPWAFGSSIGGGSGSSGRRGSSDIVGGPISMGGSTGDQRGPEVDTTATTRVVTALRGDAALVKSLPAFVREALEALVGSVDQQLALK